MTMSDVIELYDDNESTFYYVDKGGYTRIRFSDEEPEISIELQNEKEAVNMPEETEPEEKVVFKFTM